MRLPANPGGSVVFFEVIYLGLSTAAEYLAMERTAQKSKFVAGEVVANHATVERVTVI